MTQLDGPTAENATARPRGRNEALYPVAYTWLVFLSSLDILLTYIIISDAFKGIEVNYLANWLIHRIGFGAAVAYKLILISLVLLICEIVGQRRYETGRRLAEWSVAVATIPVIVAYVQLAADVVVWAMTGEVVER